MGNVVRKPSPLNDISALDVKEQTELLTLHEFYDTVVRIRSIKKEIFDEDLEDGLCVHILQESVRKLRKGLEQIGAFSYSTRFTKLERILFHRETNFGFDVDRCSAVKAFRELVPDPSDMWFKDNVVKSMLVQKYSLGFVRCEMLTDKAEMCRMKRDKMEREAIAAIPALCEAVKQLHSKLSKMTS